VSTEQDVDRNEAATPFKLEKAKEKGQTARSGDMVSSVAFLAAMLYAAAQGTELTRAVLLLAKTVLGQAASAPAAAIWPLVEQTAVSAALLLLPLFLAVACAAVAAGFAQTGFVFSLEPLHADFGRLSPARGFKRVFAIRTLFDGFRACMKLAALSAVATFTLLSLLPQFHALNALSPGVFLAWMVDDVTTLGTRMAVALLAVSALDLLYTRGEFARNMRMSRRELKDEFKNREGDPRVRSRLRELRKELLHRMKALGRTATADVVLTNPTHYAVALRYVHGEMAAPKVVAKGAGQLAAAMRGIAARHNVIVVHNPPLARRLFREVALEQDIPPGFHADVARIFVWIMEVRRQKASHGAAA
jgi:flagellar biosynthetic protein FlhB